MQISDIAAASLLESTGLATILLDRRLIIKTLNAKTRSLFADDALILAGKLVDQLLAPSVDNASINGSAFITLIQDLVEGKPAETQLTMSRTDGSVFLARIIVSMLNSKSGEQVYCLVFEDITSRINEIRKLSLSAQVFEHSGEPTMITDAMDRIV